MTNFEEKYFQTYQKTLKYQLPQKHTLGEYIRDYNT